MKRVWQHSLEAVRNLLDVSELNLDGSHTIAKNGGEAVVYQGRKRAKTRNILPIFDKQGYVLALTGIVAGNHNDASNMKLHLQSAFQRIKRQHISIQGSYFNADSAFDIKEARKICFNYKLWLNISENKRNHKQAKPGPTGLFSQSVYKRCFTAERSFAWVDKFRALPIRYDRRDLYFLSRHYIIFVMINLRDVTNL